MTGDLPLLRSGRGLVGDEREEQFVPGQQGADDRRRQAARCHSSATVRSVAVRVRRKGIGRAAVVKKDFWVCWPLAALFGPVVPSDVTVTDVPALSFNGGTSLSKVYGLIDRFSEDGDLSVDRRILITDEERPDAADLSTRERGRRIDTVEQRCMAYVHDDVLPFLSSLRISGEQLDVRIDAIEAQTIWFAFPRALPAAAYGGTAYVNRAIRLEFGARGELWPAEAGAVTPYVVEEFSALFAAPTVPVRALSPRRPDDPPRPDPG